MMPIKEEKQKDIGNAFDKCLTFVYMHGISLATKLLQ